MKIALIGNPNSGKTSVFNHLTGLNQKIGNYPGITVDKKVGFLKGGHKSSLIDFPGTYSLYPKTRDEEIVREVLMDPTHDDYPDLLLVTVDASNLERNLLLFTQVFDLGLPVILVLNMSDVAKKKGLEIDANKLSELFFNIPVVSIVARTGEHIEALKEEIFKVSERASFQPFIPNEFEVNVLNADENLQKEYTHERFKKIRQILSFAVKNVSGKNIVARHRKADEILTHRIFGYVIFSAILFLIFQAIYAWAEWPMDIIDKIFLSSSQLVKELLPPGVFTNLIAEGVLPGLGGVLIFIPQIALLFAFIFLLEESGYMSRVVFIMDRLMRPFGLNGRSVVPLISGIACAIPAIMATRTIDNWKERLNTILVTPLMSCSARLPVYTLLIAIVIPDETIGPFNLKGVVLMGLYLLGLLAALLAALVVHLIVKSDQKSFLIMEMPLYKMPRWNNLIYTLIEKIKIFTFEAGRVILAISIILWVLASYGPGDRMQEAINQIPKPTVESEIKDYKNKVASVSLSNSYIGIVGKAIEPAIEPLGYNWKIGIALITSFAAREVFVGSMATIYRVGSDFENDQTLIEKMKEAVDPKTGNKVYGLASGLSLMVFYAFAMQCMSTLAVTLRETKSWKWPFIQLVYMTSLAYLAALITFQIAG